MPQDYRIFAGAFPSGELAERIQAIRQQYDPTTARITAPHVTLAGTYWRGGPAAASSEADAIDRLERAIQGIRSFDLHLGGVHTFPPPDKPVIYLGVAVDPALLAARQALLAALGPDKHRSFTPHLTLAMRLAGAKAQRMLEDLHASTWDQQILAAPIQALQLMQRGPSDRAWRCIACFPLG